MDYETIDNFKLSRLEIILNQLFNLKLFKSKNGFDVSDLGTISIALVVAAVILGMGATILEIIQETAGVTSSTANTSVFSGNIETLVEFIPIISIIAIAAIVMGVILVFFGRAGGSEDEDTESDDEEPTDAEGYTSMNKFKVKEKEYNDNYYKEEPDYDDAKKSIWDKIFKKRYGK